MVVNMHFFFHLDAGLEVEVKDPPKGMIPPGTQMVKPKAEPQPSKVNVFSKHRHLSTHAPDCTTKYKTIKTLINQHLA